MDPRVYAVVARVAALLLGAGSLAFTASDPVRVRLMLADCEISYDHGSGRPMPGAGWGLRWNGCATLAKELFTAGALLLVASAPAKHDGPG